MKTHKIIVVGAGPAGMMAAIRAGQLGAQVLLIEKNSALGRKLLLTGKGRCNLTNACGLEEFLARFSGKKGGPFLRDALKALSIKDLMRFFEERGLSLKVERQKRVFPVTDRSSSVRDVLKKELSKLKVEILFNASVKAILRDQANCANGVVLHNKQKILADKVIIATGGISYPFTGSQGDGLRLAQTLGHALVASRPGLVPLETKQPYTKDLSGVTLKNVRLTFRCGKKQVVSPIGEFLFTDFGISGPLVLSLSGLIVDGLADNKTVVCEIDFKPALSSQQLDARFLRDFQTGSKKSIKTVLKDFLPQRLVKVFLSLSGIAAEKPVNQITQKEREKLVSLLKAFPVDIKRSLSIDKAMVTQGGVALKDLSPRSMESRIIKGLYFAGELIDVDGDTGGFNLQAAFSTGYLAGQNAAQP